MAFIQIMEMTTSRYDAIADLSRQWREATEGKRTLHREVVARDRKNPDRYIILAFFDSYESAMENSSLPETQQFSARFDEFTDEPLIFHDLDVIEDNS